MLIVVAVEFVQFPLGSSYMYLDPDVYIHVGT